MAAGTSLVEEALGLGRLLGLTSFLLVLLPPQAVKPTTAEQKSK
ncbi:hypothetical protein [Parashewanella hymeniacidonis]|nr:hypothetical protein [Parashewanella hymeniacidonis]